MTNPSNKLTVDEILKIYRSRKLNDWNDLSQKIVSTDQVKFALKELVIGLAPQELLAGQGWSRSCDKMLQNIEEAFK